MDIQNFGKAVFAIAIPVALQSMLQSSFSMIDQVMVGQLGKKAIAGIEIAGKPAFFTLLSSMPSAPLPGS